MMGLALGLRLARLTFQPLWADEGYSVYFASLDWGPLTAATAADIHPPLYYYLLKLWMSVFGPGELALRALSVLFGVATVALTFAFAKRLGGTAVGVLAALAMAVSPFHIYYSQEVRMYALAGLLAVASTLCMLQLLDGWTRGRSRRGAWACVVLYVVTTAAALYTLYYAAFIPLAQTVFVFLAYRRRPAVMARWLAVELATLLAYAPWLATATKALSTYVAGKVTVEQYAPLNPLTFFWQVLHALGLGVPSAGRGFLALGALPALALALVAAARARLPEGGEQEDSRRGAHNVLLPLCLVVIPLAAGYAVNLLWPFSPVGFQRLFLFCLPFFATLVAMGAVSLLSPLLNGAGARDADAVASPLPLLATLAGLVTVVTVTAALADFYTTPRYADDDYRPLVRRMASLGHPDDVLVAFYPWQIGFVQSYYVGDMPELHVVENAAVWADDAALMQRDLDALGRQHGRLWFVSYEAAGRLLESAVTAYLDQAAYPAVAQWFGEHRLLLYSFGGVVPQLRGAVATGDGITLDGASVNLDLLEAGRDCVRVSLRWSNVQQFADGRQVALRLADGAGRTWVQRDSAPFNGAPPAAGEGLSDNHALAVPVTTPPGSYRLLLGVYDTATRRNAALVDTAGKALGAEVELATLVVTRSGYRPPAQALALSHPVTIAFAGAPALIGFAAPAAARPGQSVQVDLYWQAGDQPPADLHVFVQARDRRNKVWGLYEGAATGSYAVSRWTDGELLRSQLSFLLAPDAPSGEYQLVVGWLTALGKERLRVQGGGDEAVIGRLAVTAREHVMTLPRPTIPAEERVGDDIQFLGFDSSIVGVATPVLRRGEQAQLTLYWRALGRMDVGYTMFVHLVDERGRIWAQDDHEPADGEAPTTSWLPGEVISDRYVLAVPADLPAGRYRLLAGVYSDGGRLRVRSGGDTIVLATIDL